MANTNTNTRYTYIDFANEAIALANGETLSLPNRFIEKAQALIATQESKSTYNKNNPKKSTAKGASETTKANANMIMAILGDTEDTARTGADINAELGTDFTALQVANACKFIPNIQSCKVVREVTNSKGLRAEKIYTAYYRA